MAKLQKNNNPQNQNKQNIRKFSLKSSLNKNSKFCASMRSNLCSLGSNAECSSPFAMKASEIAYLQRRVDRYLLQHYARTVLRLRGQKMYEDGDISHAFNIHKTAQCLRVRYSDTVGVHLSKEHKRAFYSGLIVCGNVYACPVCAAKVQERRRIEITKMFDAAYKGELGANKKVIMVTFTFSHKFGDDLTVLLKRQSEAFRLLRSGKAWSKRKDYVGFVGMIRSLEVTYGMNGWHPHTHEAWVVDKEIDVDSFREWLAQRWFNICLKVGLISEAKKDSFLEHSVQIVDKCRSSRYLAKQDDSRHWGADHELAKSTSKAGKSSGVHPFMLIRKYAEGDERSGQIYVDYVLAMKGKAQVFWSRGLKSKVGITEKSDEELAEENVDTADRLATLSKEDWDLVLRSEIGNGVIRPALLEAAEDRGSEGIKSFIENLRYLNPEGFQLE